MEPKALSVSEALGLAKNSLNKVSATIVGEVSELSDKPGYKAVYFTLSDANSALSCLMWRNVFLSTGVKLQAGMLLEVSGVFSVYAAKGRMNFDVRSMRAAGEGDLRLKVAALAKKLASQGLMDSARKRILPQFPSKLAIVTSPRGKAIHDVLRTLRRRFPYTEVLICGVAVEGAGAVAAMINGLEQAQASEAELILLVRGGGSYEDLMPFNDEALARAIAASKIPVVTGIGHEPDNSIADMVADVRASTPTAAAERVVPEAKELASAYGHLQGSLSRLMAGKLERAHTSLAHLRTRPLFSDSKQLLSSLALQVEGASRRLNQAIPDKLELDRRSTGRFQSALISLGPRLLGGYKNSLLLGATNLDNLSPSKVLTRGYAIAQDQSGHVIDSIDKVNLNEQIVLRFHDGLAEAKIMTKQGL